MFYAYVDTLVSKSVMSISGLSFASARSAPQPGVSVFMVCQFSWCGEFEKTDSFPL